jgi:hypothetical protein
MGHKKIETSLDPAGKRVPAPRARNRMTLILGCNVQTIAFLQGEIRGPLNSGPVQ